MDTKEIKKRIEYQHCQNKFITTERSTICAMVRDWYELFSILKCFQSKHTFSINYLCISNTSEETIVNFLTLDFLSLTLYLS